MAEVSKRRKAQSGGKTERRRKPAGDVKRSGAHTTEPKCWLCSQPLAASTVASVLGPGIFEVHQHCYEQAMRS